MIWHEEELLELIKDWEPKPLTSRLDTTQPWAELSPTERAWNWPDLDENSIIFEIGGHEGRFTNEMIQRYQPHIYFFEPSPQAFGVSKQKVAGYPKIKMYNFGLGHKSGTFAFGNDTRHGGSFLSDNPPVIQARMVDISEFFMEHNITHVDFMQINAEGIEFYLLPHMINTGILDKVQRLMLHWHTIFTNEAMVSCCHAIHAKMCETHHMVRGWTFEVWEKNE